MYIFVHPRPFEGRIMLHQFHFKDYIFFKHYGFYHNVGALDFAQFVFGNPIMRSNWNIVWASPVSASPNADKISVQSNCKITSRDIIKKSWWSPFKLSSLCGSPNVIFKTLAGKGASRPFRSLWLPESPYPEVGTWESIWKVPMCWWFRTKSEPYAPTY